MTTNVSAGGQVSRRLMLGGARPVEAQGHQSTKDHREPPNGSTVDVAPFIGNIHRTKPSRADKCLRRIPG